MAAGDRTPALAMLGAGFVGGAATIGLIWSVSTRPVAVPTPPASPPPVRTLEPIERTEPAPPRSPAEPVRPDLAGAPAAAPEEAPPAPPPDAPVEDPVEATGAPLAEPPPVEPARPDPVTTRIRINTATAAELDLLPGIGPALAARIIESRRANGPFSGPGDLQRVRGIGPKTAENIAPLVRFD